MLRWMRHGLLISSAFLTLGMFAPNEYVKDVQAQLPPKVTGDSNEKPLIYKISENDYELFHEVLPSDTEHYIHRVISSAEVYTKFMFSHAYEQSMMKFGETISSKINESFTDEIYPRLKDALAETTNNLTEQEWPQVKVSNQPAPGFGEKIFHLYNEDSGEDIFRFHVRRDQPPKKGHWFNFHYHTHVDRFEKHHDLGSIYWGKDMPPRWLA